MNPNCLNALKQKKMDDKLLHEKRRSNLFQNKYSAEIKKKHAIIQELETIQNESFNEFPISFTEENEQTLHYDIPKLLTELTDVTRIVVIWKEQSFIPKSDTIYVCLSVDAIYFTPDIHLDEKSIFSGLILNESDEKLISKNAFTRFSKNPNELQIFLQLNSDKIIRSGFIFHVQPYNPIYDTFISHVHPASNGKANDIILFKLDEIKTILSYSFDGDNEYSVLHQKYFKSYFNIVIKKYIIYFSKTLVFKVNSDFLHLIKRLRYRLFGGEIHSGFLISDPSFNTSKLESIFPIIPNVVWNDEIYTKMHDSLPLLLFKPEHFLYLLLNGFFVEATYFAPISLSILVLQISFWILALHYKDLD